MSSLTFSKVKSWPRGWECKHLSRKVHIGSVEGNTSTIFSTACLMNVKLLISKCISLSFSMFSLSLCREEMFSKPKSNKSRNSCTKKVINLDIYFGGNNALLISSYVCTCKGGFYVFLSQAHTLREKKNVIFLIPMFISILPYILPFSSFYINLDGSGKGVSILFRHFVGVACCDWPVIWLFRCDRDSCRLKNQVVSKSGKSRCWSAIALITFDRSVEGFSPSNRGDFWWGLIRRLRADKRTNLLAEV